MMAGKREVENDIGSSPDAMRPVGDSSANQPERAPASPELSSAGDDELDELMRQDFGDDQDADENARPLEDLSDELEAGADLDMRWYILKVQVNRETSICETLERRIKVAGMERFFSDILVPTEDVREYSKSGKQRIVKRKLFPGYIVVKMHINDESWFLVRDTPGIGDFTGAAGKPVALSEDEIRRIIATTRPDPQAAAEEVVKTAIRFKSGDHVRVKEGYFQNCEGEVSAIDERNGRVTVMISFLGRPNPVQLDHWQIEQM
jgi:transcription termination/antitermination protein NusG